MTVYKTEKAKEKGARYLLQVHLAHRLTGEPAPSIFWETRTQVEAHEVLLSILALYNKPGQPYCADFATIETTKGKQVFARNLKNIWIL